MQEETIIVRKYSKYHILRNLLSLAFGHCLVFTAFDCLSPLQSTVNHSIGMTSQAVVHASFTISAFFLPTILIKHFGCKTTLAISVFSICPYLAANFYPIWWTMIPTAIFCGLSFGPFWAARSAYVNEISFQYARYTKTSISVVNAWFFGIYAFFHENALIWGNTISYFILRNTQNETVYNVTDTTLSICGSDFCEKETELITPNLQPPSDSKWYILISTYLCLVIAAGFVIIFLLDPLDNKVREDNEKSTNKSTLSAELLVATFRHLRKKNQLLLLPLSFYCGLSTGFYNSDFTKSYIACAWGISQVGFVTICYGVAGAIMDCSGGFLVKHLTRIPVFLLAAISHFATLVTLLIWKPTPANSLMAFVLSGVYGVGASVWWSQIAALYGVIFKKDEEAAFSNFYFWTSLGFSIAYACSNLLCTNMKIYILLTLLVIGIGCYLLVEFIVNRSNKLTERAS